MGKPDIEEGPRCFDGSSTTSSAGVREEDAMARLTACAFASAATTTTGCVASIAEAREVIRHVDYPPVGDRGVATYNRAARWGAEAKKAVTGVGAPS